MEVLGFKLITKLYHTFIGPSINLYTININGWEARVLLFFIQKDFTNVIFNFDIYLHNSNPSYLKAFIFEKIFINVVRFSSYSYEINFYNSFKLFIKLKQDEKIWTHKLFTNRKFFASESVRAFFNWRNQYY